MCKWEAIEMRTLFEFDYKDYKENGNIKWNFTKILIGRDGEIVGRFEPTASMDKLRETIRKELAR